MKSVPFYSLHAGLKIRERGKHLKEQFFDIGKRVWEIYRCENKEKMRRSIDSLRRWPKRNLTGVVLEKVLDLCSKKRQWTKHLEHRCCHRTGNMLDRLMRLQHKFFERGQGFHGKLPSAKLRCRSWALLYNYWHWCPRTQKLNDGYRCPAERLNKKRYADNWLQNLLIATSNTKKRTPPILE